MNFWVKLKSNMACFGNQNIIKIKNMKTYSMTQAGSLVKLVSAVLVVLGANPFSEEEANALVVVIGLIGEVAGFIISWIGRMRGGDIDVLGRKV
jgi:hypothetical protein